jgi:hypothetical protein
MKHCGKGFYDRDGDDSGPVWVKEQQMKSQRSVYTLTQLSTPLRLFAAKIFQARFGAFRCDREKFLR